MPSEKSLARKHAEKIVGVNRFDRSYLCVARRLGYGGDDKREAIDFLIAFYRAAPVGRRKTADSKKPHSAVGGAGTPGVKYRAHNTCAAALNMASVVGDVIQILDHGQLGQRSRIPEMNRSLADGKPETQYRSVAATQNPH